MLNLAGYQQTNQVYAGTRTLVYRATQDTEGQPVIIKVLRNPNPNFNELVQFRNQYIITRHLQHPAILQPIALKRHDNSYALVMPDSGAIALPDYWHDSDHSLTEFLAIAIQLGSALHYLSQQRIIHKDIKPDNILIHPETKQIKLIDFSLSSLLPTEQQQLINPNVLEGTLAYLSPEQTGRMNRGIDYRTDFYSLGVTFFELLTGKLPFTITDPMKLVYCHIAQPAKFPVESEVPEVLQKIVIKLMGKNAEDRYQNALGLKHDLEKCQKHLETTGKIPSFELGEKDQSDRFIIPEKLYGRETEVQTIINAFEEVARGKTQMMLVAGFSGIGKTAVVNEVHKPIVRQRGYFIKGKYDQFQRNIPFSAFVQAFRDLMRQLLSESDTELGIWKTKIIKALGDNAQVIIDVVPELETIIGTQATAPELSGSAAQNRFNLLFQKFITVFTTPEHPLVMFLDDLQWADSASLNLMKVLMGNTETGYLLILGAYRNNEVFPAHPLMLTLSELEKNQAVISTITLQPLALQDITQLVADTLSCSQKLAQPLSELVYQKTQGNPFFTTQFLKGLQADGLIKFNQLLGYWECDLVKVHDAVITDDVVEFMAKRLQKFSVQTQKVLKLAACIGNQFELETLAVVCEESDEEIAEDIWSALQEGLILPISETYKFFQGDVEDTTAPMVNVGYRFLHDRVQQATYSLIPEEDKQATHLKIGRSLLNQIQKEELNTQIFNIVNQLNIGRELIENKSEKIELANLNLKAAQKAKKSTAYSAAVEYLDFGIKLLEYDDWIDEYELKFSLYRECSENEYLQGNIERSESLARQTLEQATSVIDKVEIHNILIVQYTVTARYKDAINEGKIALALLGIQWNEDDLSKELDDDLKSAQHKLGDRDISSLIDISEIEIPEKKGAIKVLHNLLPAAFSIDQELWSVLVVKMVNVSLQYGHISECCFGYSFYGVLVNSMFGDYKLGYEFGILSLKLSHKFNDLAQQAKACNILAAFLLHWKKHISNCENINNQGYSAGLESGQIQFIGYIAYNRILSIFHSGKNLNDLSKDFFVYLPVLEKIKHYYAYDITVGIKLVTSNLMSRHQKNLANPNQEIDEIRYLETCRSRNSFAAICIYQILKAQMLYLFDRPKDALLYLTSSEENFGFIAGHFTVVEYNYYHCLSLLMLYEDASSKEQSRILEQIKENQKDLKKWAENCQENFQHKVDLIAAEKSRVLDQKLEAIELYDKAIAGAKANEYIQEEALANELAAKFYLEWGKEKIAATYMQSAYYCYARWGAKAKTEQLETQYPQLLSLILQQQQIESNPFNSLENLTQTLHSNTPGQTSSTKLSDTLDLVSILQATHAISSTIELDQLLSDIVEIILTNAGAQKTALLIPQADQWQIRAIAEVVSDGIVETSTKLLTLTAKSLVPIRLIQYVKNTHESILINESQTDIPGILEGYLLKYQPQSILCIPLLYQGNLVGIVYLEHPTTKGIFTSYRQTIVQFLCTQAAISLQNAQLYDQATQALRDLKAAQLQIVQSEKMSTLGNLMAGVAHEINNPTGFLEGNIQPAEEYVQDLLGLIDLYQSEYPQPNEVIAEEIEAIELEFIREDLLKLLGSMNVGVERIRNISNSLRTFARKDQEHKTVFNIHEGIDSTLLILKHRTKANQQRPGIDIVRNYGDIPQVECFPGQLNQVLMNILANAIDTFDEASLGKTYAEIEMNPNRITIETSMLDENQIQIAIEDNGCGMKPETKDRIFEYGFTTKEVGKGTGLGMAIAYQIITEKHSGTITCDSKVAQGTIFTISLPV